MKVFEASNAGNNSKIEEHEISKIHYSGTILNVYHAIVVTMFNGIPISRFVSRKIP